MTDNTDQDSPTKGSKKRNVQRITAENVPSFYTNSAQATVSIYDIKLVLGVIESATEESLVVRDVAHIVMSPQHAKALSFLLQTRIEKYEKRFGPLPDVSGIITELGD